MNENKPDGEIRFESDFAKKLDNFWFYNKWKILVASFIVLVLSVCIIQSCSKENPDVVVMYAGPYYYSANETLEVKEELKKVLSADYNGDGEKIVGLVTYHVMTDEQLEEYQKLLIKEAEEKNEKVQRVDNSYFTNQSEMCNNYLLTGECAILLVDPNVFGRLSSSEGRLRKLSDIFIEVPSSAVNDYGIRFSDTALAKSSNQLGKLPDDTVLCMLNPYIVGNTKDPAKYSRMIEMFKEMAQ